MQYLYVKAYIDELRSNGRYSFSLRELLNHSDHSVEAVKKALQRLKGKKEIAIIRREFYVILPPEYRSKGILPPSLFIAELMRFMERDYYVGLLNAAAFYGAAHQQPQNFSVITTKPALREIDKNNLRINFYLKKEWAPQDITEVKVDTGYIKVSSPELTALDLVSYFDQSGGFNRVATVLEELTESLDVQKLGEAAERFTQVTTVQRLGYILDEILGQKELSQPLANYLKNVNHFPVLLRPEKEKSKNMTTGNNWKVVRNIEVETDI